ncbi:MAG: transglutaminase domain-containing protein [Planctomycetota bacterium]
MAAPFLVGPLLPRASVFGQVLVVDAESGGRFGPEAVYRYRVGVRVTARKGPVRDLFGMVAVPLECPEQEIEVVDETISTHVDRADYRNVGDTRSGGDGARQLIVSIPRLEGGAEAEALLTFEVRTKTVLPPAEPESLAVPDRKRRELKPYLGRSPMIETKNGKIRKALREALADSAEDEPPWKRVERIYDFVQEKVKYVEGDDKSALATLKDGSGDCQNISALFVALCRTHGVPARMVWVHEHQYPEFCLADADDQLLWLPCESSGSRSFGEMPLARVILQKGDNFRVPERKQALRYASDYLVGKPYPGSGKPRVRYIRELV